MSKQLKLTSGACDETQKANENKAAAILAAISAMKTELLSRV